jgi:hypothetical protein
MERNHTEFIRICHFVRCLCWRVMQDCFLFKVSHRLYQEPSRCPAGGRSCLSREAHPGAIFLGASIDTSPSLLPSSPKSASLCEPPIPLATPTPQSSSASCRQRAGASDESLPGATNSICGMLLVRVTQFWSGERHAVAQVTIQPMLGLPTTWLLGSRIVTEATELWP